MEACIKCYGNDQVYFQCSVSVIPVLRTDTIVRTCFTDSYNMTTQWRHSKRGGVSNHRRLDCLLNRLFRRRSKKTSKPSVTDLCEGNSPVIPLTKGQQREKCFHLMTSSWNHIKRGNGKDRWWASCSVFIKVYLQNRCYLLMKISLQREIFILIVAAKSLWNPQHIEAEAICRLHFQIHVLVWKSLYFYSIFNFTCSWANCMILRDNEVTLKDMSKISSIFWAPSQYKDRLIYVWWFPC